MIQWDEMEERKKAENSVVISGYGGQGALFAGVLLAECLMRMKKFVTWLPSYGAQMRGGVANCTVVISEDEISSPVQKNPDYLIALNSQSIEHFENDVIKDGLIFVNSPDKEFVKKREDVGYFVVPANFLAKKIGEIKCANLVMLGAFLQVFKPAAIKCLIRVIDTSKASVKGASVKFIRINRRAIALGASFANKMLKKNGEFKNFPDIAQAGLALQHK